MAQSQFEEKILYRTHQHWIIPTLQSLKNFCIGVLPITVVLYFSVNSWVYTIVWWSILIILMIAYSYYLWYHSWLLVGNQKITLIVRNGIFSQFAMNIRYRNIRDSAVSKNNIFGFLLKYGTLFVRSSANEWDFTAHHVPKVWKVYALVNALSRYNDDERASIDTIEKLHSHHTHTEFSGNIEHDTPNDIVNIISSVLTIPGVWEVVEIADETRKALQWIEEIRNHGVHESLRRKHLICLTHDSTFRAPSAPITATTQSGEVYFPGVPFPEVTGKDVISASPGTRAHAYLRQFFPYATDHDATILVGWNN